MSDSLQRLLQLQERDIAADQLRHRKATLPDRAALAERRSAITALDADRAEVAGRLADTERVQKRLEDEVASVADKHTAEHTRLYSGSITSPRELQALQEEIDALARRQRELEDELLEVMEAAEPLAAEVASLDERRVALTADAEALQAAIGEAERAIDGELAGVGSERDAIAADLSPELVTTYDRLRARLGGVAVARLEGAQCLGCHLSLPATEIDAIRHAPPDAVVMHEECGRILVR